MKKFSPEEIDAALQKAPQMVREQLDPGFELAETVADIGSKFGLHIDVIGKLGELNRNMLIGLITPQEFVGNLKELGISDSQSNQVVEDINQRIFKPLYEKMRGQTEPSTPKQPISVPVASPPAPIVKPLPPSPAPTPPVVSKSVPPPAPRPTQPMPPPPPRPPTISPAAPPPQAKEAPKVEATPEIKQASPFSTAPSHGEPALPKRGEPPVNLPGTGPRVMGKPPEPPKSLNGEPDHLLEDHEEAHINVPAEMPKPLEPKSPAPSAAPPVTKYKIDPYREPLEGES